MKKRRGPYPGRLPDAIAQNGYVVDLIAEITATAARLGRAVSFHKKNDDYFVAVMIPNAEELAEIDRQSAGEEQTHVE